jgi:hypothetical protein
MLKGLQNWVAHPIMAISMVSEGTFKDPLTGEKASYLLMSLETQMESILNSYRMVKRREIGDSGEVLRIMSMEKDDLLPADKTILELQKFTHVMRPNLSDAKDRTIYN